MISEDEEKTLPLYAQKEAERIVHESQKINAKVNCLVLHPSGITEMVWLDPYYGFLAVRGMEERGFIRVGDLPSGTRILNQGIAEEVIKS